MDTIFKDKTRIPQQERGIKTRKQIIDASMKLFSKKGFHNTNSKEIAVEAGVATGCFYSYFLDKREVFLEALKIYNDQFNNIIKEHLAKINEFDNDKREYLRGIINAALNAHELYSEFHNELIAMKFSDPDVAKIMLEQRETNILSTLKYLKHFQSEVKVTNLDAASVVIVECFCAIVDSIVYSNNSIAKEPVITEMVEMIIKYLFL